MHELGRRRALLEERLRRALRTGDLERQGFLVAPAVPPGRFLEMLGKQRETAR